MAKYQDENKTSCYSLFTVKRDTDLQPNYCAHIVLPAVTVNQQTYAKTVLADTFNHMVVVVLLQGCVCVKSKKDYFFERLTQK